MPRARQAVLFWGVALGWAAFDQLIKAWARVALAPMYTPHPVVGEWVRLTLLFNPGAAFGLNVGGYSRLVFTVLTLVALVVLWRLHRDTAPGHWVRTLALGLVSGGALGNLIDRLTSARGVTDFLDVGVSATTRWPTFNTADIAVSTGAILLAWVLWREDERQPERAPAPAAPRPERGHGG